MNVGIASHGTDGRKEQRRQFWMAAGGAALALMVAASLGTWLMGRAGDPRVGEQPAASPPVPAAPAVRAEASPPVVYLVATPEQAAYALRFSADINALRAELGQPQESVGALVVGPDLTLALDALPGAPGTRYYDLRTP